MKTISTLILILFVVGCSHTTHMSPSEDGKTAWIAQDSIMLIFTTSKKFYCIADPVKPKCIQTIDIEQEPEQPKEEVYKPKNIFF